LLEAGWRILVIWECAVRRQSPVFGSSSFLKKIIEWIEANVGRLAILSESNFEECL
jgi:G:T-mismatch repair DNA endonuclease (very short patch repair protein)